MVVQLFICLIAISVASLLITQGRRRRIWSVLLLLGLCIISYFFMDSLNSSSAGFIYQWLPYDTLKADINISSSLRMQQMFLPLICLLAAQVYLNTIFSSETHSLHFNTLMLLNFISIILLASSRDFLQLMFAGGIFSIIGFYMPDQISSKKKIFIFNFLAEMAVFMALAIIYGSMGNISLSSLTQYDHIGHHKDLVAVLLLFAIGCKCGLFLLNGQYFVLKDVSFNRLCGMMTLSFPLSGIILANKLYPVLQASAIPGIILPWWCLISIVMAFFLALFNNNMKSKVISLFLASYAYILLKINGNAADIYIFVPAILMLNFLTSLIFIMVSLSSSDENDVTFLGGFWRYTPVNLIISFVVILSISSIFAVQKAEILDFIFAIIYISILSLNQHIIYLGKTRADEKVIAFAKNVSILYWFPLILGCMFIIGLNHSWSNNIFYVLSFIAIAIFIFIPSLWLTTIGNGSIFKVDILSLLYEIVLIYPLKFIGRILWLVFDVILIEHNIIGSISERSSNVILSLHNLQESKFSNYILSIFLGMLIIAIYLGYYIYE